MSHSTMKDGQFTRLFIIMILAMIVLTCLLVVFAGSASTDVSELRKAQSDMENSSSLANRIAPVGEFAAETTAQAAPPVAVAKDLPGDEVYNASCAACHGTGVAGAPAVGDASAWTDRISQGADTLYDHAINGYQGSAGFMPAKGGAADLTDNSVKAAVDYMLDKSK